MRTPGRASNRLPVAAGLYVHVPFCAALCPYCDFAVVVGRDELHERYCDALVAEAEASGWDEPVGTVFVGGGTPTAVDAHLLARTLDKLRGVLPVRDPVETTIEANPESVDARALRVLRDAGVDRVSIGAQSFAPHVLRALGRTHAPADTVRAVEAAYGAGIANVGLDLIYGSLGESLDDWRGSLEQAVALGVRHVSCYALTIEERTAFGKAVARGAMSAPDEDGLAARYELAVAVLGAAGYEHYELSNWALPGFTSRHNLVYWTQGDYLGLGLGAHSHRDGRRWWNARSISRYLADPTAARDGEERLDAGARAEEWVALRLRLTEGLDLAEAERRLGRDLGPTAASLEAAGLAHRDPATPEASAPATPEATEPAHPASRSPRHGPARLRLTTRGMLLENEVAARLLDGRDPERSARLPDGRDP